MTGCQKDAVRLDALVTLSRPTPSPKTKVSILPTRLKLTAYHVSCHYEYMDHAGLHFRRPTIMDALNGFGRREQLTSPHPGPYHADCYS